MHDSDKAPEGRPAAKPPFLVLVPVGLALFGFIGYQTYRMGTDSDVNRAPVVGQPALAQAVVDRGVITVHPLVPMPARRANAASVAVAAKPQQSPPATSASAEASPIDAPSAAALAPAIDTAPSAAASKVSQSTPPHPKAQIAHAKPHDVAALASLGGLPQTAQPAASSTPAAPQPDTESPADTDVPMLHKATPKPVQVAVAQESAVPAIPNGNDRVAEARMTYAASPDFPEIARDQGAHGTSVVYVTVDAAGAIVHMSIASSSGNTALDRAALSAARSSRYVAPRVDGKPATETYRVVYDFAP